MRFSSVTMASMLAISVGMSVAGPAWAAAEDAEQQAEPQDAIGNDIVVTARRREERLQDVPVAVTAIGEKLLDQRAIKTTEDLRYSVPSLQVAPSPFGTVVPGYTIRGQRQLEQLITQDPSVGVYFADVVQQRPHGTNSALYDLSSVQVLKGPQGTLFGRNTTGGAVLFVPNAPSSELGGSASIAVGNYNLRRGTVVLNVPITDNLFIRGSGQITRRDGYNLNLTTGQRVDDERTESARFSVRWQPMETITNDTIFTYFHERDNGNGLIITAVRPNQPNDTAGTLTQLAAAREALLRQQGRSMHVIENNHPSSAYVDSYQIINTTKLDLSDTMSLKNIMGFRHVRSIVSLDFDGSPATLFHTRNDLNSDQFSNEIQLSGTSLSDRLNWIGGFYYFRESGDDIQNSVLGSPRINDGYGRNTSVSAYLQGGYKLTDKLTLTAGGRYTFDTRFLIARSKIGDPPTCRLTDENGVKLNPCSKTVSTGFESPTWTVGLDYKPDSDTLVYLTHRRGYRSGGWNLRSLTPLNFVPFKPEYVTDVEAGFKVDLFDRRLRINAAAYHQWYRDIQRTISATVPGSNPPTVATNVVNAASAKIYGGEIEIVARPIDLLEFGANAAYMHEKYDKFEDSVGDLSGNRFTLAPRFQGSAYARVNLPLAADQGEAGIQLGVYHQSSMEASDINTPFPLKPYTLLDLTANWNRVMGSPVDVSFFIKNLTDKEYTTSAIAQYGDRAGLRFGGGAQAETIGAPRTIGVEMKVHFGSGV